MNNRKSQLRLKKREEKKERKQYHGPNQVTNFVIVCEK